MKASFWTRLFDLIAPRPCAVCGRRLSVSESLMCAPCMMHLPLTGFQLSPLDNPMARLLWGQFPVERVAALFYYAPHDAYSQMIYDLKYHGQRETAEALGSVIAHLFDGSAFFEGIDAIIPVPLTKKRRWQRGYNQSEEIAKGLRDETGLPIYNKVVKRIVFHGSQTTLGSRDRHENVEGAFQLTDAQKIAGKHVLLVDDIMTTGATITACAKELCKVPSIKVSVLTAGFAKS